MKHTARLIIGLILSCGFAAPGFAQSGSLAHALVGEVSEYVVRSGDSLTAIGARAGESVAAIARRNGLNTKNVIRPGQRISIDNRHIVPAGFENGVLINLPQRMLFIFHDGRLAAAHPVGLGKPTWPTPAGTFRITELRKDPTWNVPRSIQEEMQREGKAVQTHVAPGPDNPLGKEWIGLSIAGYGIHGTNAPPSVYHFQSHGCIRLHPDDAERLFSQVNIGMRGQIVYEPVLLAELPDQSIELEVNPDIYHQAVDAWTLVQSLAAEHGLTARIDWQRAARVVELQEGVATRIDRQLPPLGPARQESPSP